MWKPIQPLRGDPLMGGYCFSKNNGRRNKLECVRTVVWLCDCSQVFLFLCPSIRVNKSGNTSLVDV